MATKKAPKPEAPTTTHDEIIELIQLVADETDNAIDEVVDQVNASFEVSKAADLALAKFADEDRAALQALSTKVDGLRADLAGLRWQVNTIGGANAEAQHGLLKRLDAHSMRLYEIEEQLDKPTLWQRVREWFGA